MKLACSNSKEATSFEQLEEHIFPWVLESYNINVIQQALILSHMSHWTSYFREVICEVTSVDCTYIFEHVQLFLLFLLRKMRRRDQTEFSLSNLHLMSESQFKR